MVSDVADLVQLTSSHDRVVEHVEHSAVQRLGPVQHRQDRTGHVQATLAQSDAQLGDQGRVLVSTLDQSQRVLDPFDVDPERDHAA